jgi:hypothetical protein
VAATAHPRPSSDWSPAEPKFAEGPEIATADAALLPLGAPVPAPAASASELGCVLPIFEAVESDYFRTRDQDLAGPSEPQAGQPTLADQPVPSVTSAGLPQRIPRADRILATRLTGSNLCRPKRHRSLLAGWPASSGAPGEPGR